MTGRPVVVVVGVDAEETPPGIDAASDVVELRFAPTAEVLGESIAEADALLAWFSDPDWLPAVWTKS
ncbi:MAG TPA: hypothetical protein VF351_02940, partial [Actinomycetota bacterium]